MIQRIASTLLGASVFFILSVPAVLADSISGRVEYAELYALSVGVDGIVDGIAAKEGERVLAGTLLLALVDTVFNANITAVNTKFALIQEELQESKRSFDRDQALYDEGSLSTVELDLARIEMLRQKSRVAEVNAELVTAKSQKDMSQITAPEAGLVLQVNVARGQRVNMSARQKPMLVFAANALKVVSRIDSDQQSVPALSEKVKLNVGGTSTAGTVRTIFSENGSTVVTFSIDNSQPVLKPGSVVTIEF